MARRYPALFVLLMVVIGIFLSDNLTLAPLIWFIAALVITLAAVFIYFKKNTDLGTILFLLGIGLFSCFHFALRYQSPGARDLSRFSQDRPIVRLFGEISDWPDIRANRIELKIEVDSIIKDGRLINTDGAILLKITDTSNVLQRGDRVDFRGRLYPLSVIRPTGKFDYGRYLNLKGVRALVYLPTVLDVRVDRRSRFGLASFVDQIRSVIVSSLNRNLEPTEAALARGFLIGETRDIPSDIYEMFRDSGTLHLLAVSGSNVSLVLLFFHYLFRPFKFSRRRKELSLILMVLLFTQLAYGEPSVVRAAIMASLIILARLFERRYDLNQLIAAAALIILLADPGQLFDVGFQLSFITAWGLILTGPILTNWLGRHLQAWYGWIISLFAISLAAQLFSMPIIAYQFERIPAISVFANLIVIPLVSLGVIGIMAILLGNLILPTLGLFIGSLVNPILKLIVLALVWLGGENMVVWKTGSLFTGSSAFMVVIVVYAVLVLAVLSIYHKRLRRVAIIFGLTGLNLLLVIGCIRAFTDNQRSVLVNSIPSGVVVAIPTEVDGEVDLVVSGCRSGMYSISDNIIGPWLDRHDCEQVKRLFLLQADYNCFPDMLSLASELKAQTVYVSEAQRAVMADHIARLENPPNWEWLVLPIKTSFSASPGISLTNLGLVVRSEQGTILVSDIIPRLLVDKIAPLKNNAGKLSLVYNGRWKPSPDDWKGLDTLGFDLVVCSDIAQQLPEEVDMTDLSPDRILPDYIVNLRRTGPIQLNSEAAQLIPDL
jgi:competence protein ComEC